MKGGGRWVYHVAPMFDTNLARQQPLLIGSHRLGLWLVTHPFVSGIVGKAAQFLDVLRHTVKAEYPP
jgi:hypothetical protein